MNVGQKIASKGVAGSAGLEQVVAQAAHQAKVDRAEADVKRIERDEAIMHRAEHNIDVLPPEQEKQLWEDFAKAEADAQATQQDLDQLRATDPELVAAVEHKHSVVGQVESAVSGVLHGMLDGAEKLIGSVPPVVDPGIDPVKNPAFL